MGKTNFLKAAHLNLEFGATARTAAATVYAALFSDTNTKAQRDAGTVTELTGSAYARVAITNNTTNFPNATGTTPTSKSNGTTITWPTPTAAWATVHAVGFFDASSSGNLLWWADLVSTEVDGTAATSGTITAPGHSFANTDYVKFSTIDGVPLPTGLTDGAYYYVINSATDTFKVSLTSGGSAVSITGSGGGKFGKDLSQTPGSGSTVQIAISALTINEN